MQKLQMPSCTHNKDTQDMDRYPAQTSILKVRALAFGKSLPVMNLHTNHQFSKQKTPA